MVLVSESLMATLSNSLINMCNYSGKCSDEPHFTLITEEASESDPMPDLSKYLDICRIDCYDNSPQVFWFTYILFTT